MGELGILYHHSPRERDGGAWQWSYMFQLGLIIGGGTAQIQKNIIAERGFEMPRAPNPADMARQKQRSAERSVGKERVSTCRSRWLAIPLKKKKQKTKQKP